ncbi:ParA family protein [Brachybacterium horti]
MKLSIANTKGGATKTASTIMLAAVLAELGLTVQVWDADTQGSATVWAEDAAEGGTALPFDVIAVNARTVRRTVPAGVDHVIIDTPPGDAAIVQAAIDTSDRVLLPTQASPEDVRRTWLTLDAAMGSDPAVLITVAERNTREFRDAWTALKDGGAPLLDTVIDKATRFKRETGRLPRETYGYENVARELGLI